MGHCRVFGLREGRRVQGEQGFLRRAFGFGRPCWLLMRLPIHAAARVALEVRTADVLGSIHAFTTFSPLRLSAVCK